MSAITEPTRIYVKAGFRGGSAPISGAIHGISHLPAGAFFDKISRILPENMDACIKKLLEVPEIFRLSSIKQYRGCENVSHFEYGDRFSFICAKSDAGRIMKK